MLPPKRQNLFPPFATTFDGDPAECSKHLGRARGMLSLMRRSVPPVKSRTETTSDGVEIRVTTNPNHIYIKAGGQIYITYPDWKSPLVAPLGDIHAHRDYFIHKSMSLITEEPPPLAPPNRAMPLPRFNPTVSATLKAGGEWWVSKDKAQCVSHFGFNYWIKGQVYPSPVGQIYAMCISKLGNVFVSYYAPTNTLWISVVNKDGASIVNRSFHTVNGFQNMGFLKDSVTFIFSDAIGTVRVIFSTDYTTNTTESIPLSSPASGVINTKDYVFRDNNSMATKILVSKTGYREDVYGVNTPYTNMTYILFDVGNTTITMSCSMSGTNYSSVTRLNGAVIRAKTAPLAGVMASANSNGLIV